jgi:hypothetical protein
MKHLNPLKRHIVLLALILTLVAVFAVQTSRFQTSNILANAQTGTSVDVLPQTSTPQVGQTLTVNLTITNVQNLYALDVTLDWNNSVLQFVNVSLLLGVQTHQGGVLYGNQVSSSTSPGDIYLQQNEASQEIGEYHLVATSVNPADSFNGSGIIATVTFNVANAGYSALSLQSDLADHPVPGETTSNPIDHQDVSSSITASIIPEFPSAVAVALLMAVVTVGVLFSRKSLKKRET